MNGRSKFKFFTFLFFMFIITFCFSFKMNSYAETRYVCYGIVNNAWQYVNSFSNDNSNRRFCFVKMESTSNPVLCSNLNNTISIYSTRTGINNNQAAGTTNTTLNVSGSVGHSDNLVFYTFTNSSLIWGYTDFSVNAYVFNNYDDAANYLVNNIEPELVYNPNLNLDDLKITSWNVGSALGYHYDFRYKVNTTWSDSSIYNVIVRVKGTRKTDDFAGNDSPFSFKIHGYDYTNVNGDVVQIIATPYDVNGAYGNSLYSSFVYDNLHPWTYIWRKLFKTNDYDNTIEIPYNDPSGNDNVITFPVDGVTNNYTYNIKYNPQTEEITNQYLVDNYYTLVVDYPEDLSGNETVINETQNYINEYYTTNNYYQTTKDVDVDFDFDFGDISSNDAQGFKTQFDGFFDGLGNFIGKLAKLVVGLAPWLSPAVAVWIVAGFGFLVALLVLLLVIKLVSFFRSLLPF